LSTDQLAICSHGDNQLYLARELPPHSKHGPVLLRRRQALRSPAFNLSPSLTTPPHTELLNIHSAFHQGQFASVVSYDTAPLSPTNQLRAHILQLRAQIELGNTQQVLDELEHENPTPDTLAVRALAQYTQDPEDGAVREEVLALAQEHGDNATVQVLCGTVLSNLGLKEEALTVLAKHTGSLDA